ncbi:hypothetical protein ACFH4J_003403 [Escherichia coli]|uniref:hypothetical protein n=1 Tax=Enterobacter hormaechei TaxID=158836 RepID=UPI0027D2AE72|nr:hypothetical protein [Enterobacter hormaechei]WLZ51936.1 hypothetical protein QPR65_22650 [Enterobacter hormaechei]
MVKAHVVGTHEEVSAYLTQTFPDQKITVIVWTENEVKELASENGMSLTDEQAFLILEDIANNENHEFGENNYDVLTYIESQVGDE